MNGCFIRFSNTRHMPTLSRGMYLCADKTVIIGEWDDNEFIYGRVKFPNGEEYFGNFLFSQYCGDGLYKVPGVGTIIGTFSGCSLLNEVTLADINGFTWRGEATGNSAILYPVNQFLESSYYVGDTNVVPKATKDNLTTLYRAGLRKSSKVSLGPSTTGKSSRSRGSRKFHHK